jgi:hypothetical protein
VVTIAGVAGLSPSNEQSVRSWRVCSRHGWPGASQAGTWGSMLVKVLGGMEWVLRFGELTRDTPGRGVAGLTWPKCCLFGLEQVRISRIRKDIII